jgi:D-specific alpha-keto acid dehydrogenase
VLITPHTAYYTEHALSDIVENSIINCANFDAAASSKVPASIRKRA